MIDQPLAALYRLFASVEGAGLAQRSVVQPLDIRTDPTTSAGLRLVADAPLVYLQRLRLAGVSPRTLDRACSRPTSPC